MTSCSIVSPPVAKPYFHTRLARAIQSVSAQISPVLWTSAAQIPWLIIVTGGWHWKSNEQASASQVLPAPQSESFVQLFVLSLLQVRTVQVEPSTMSA